MKLTNEESRECRKRLEQWQKPSEMRRACNDILQSLGSADLSGRTGVDFLIPARAVAGFAGERGADAARLIPVDYQWHDFELQFGSRKEQWKFAEADESNQNGAACTDSRPFTVAEGGVERDTVAAWIKRADAAPEAIRAQCAVKAEKHYAGWVRLLVHLNVQEYGIRQREIEASFPDATAPARDVFSEVWVFWKERAYCIWRDGRLALQAGIGSRHSEKQPERAGL